MHPAVAVVALVVAAAVAAAGIVLLVTRRTHLRSWRLGIFYESEERYGEEPLGHVRDDDDREDGEHD